MMLAGFGIEQTVGVEDEITHLCVVYRALRRALPGVVSGLVVRIGADEVHFGQVLELDMAHVLEFAADDEMQQLLVGLGSHQGLLLMGITEWSFSIISW